MTLQELGQSIREKREAAGLSIDDVAGRIKISARILRSIEEGSLVGLPHAVYTKSFIRAFGLLVGYDAEELGKYLEELFPQESLDETSAEVVLRPLPLQDPGRGKRILALLLLLIFLGAVAGGGWYVVTTYGGAIVELVKKPFSAISGPLSDPQNNDGERQSGGGDTSDAARQVETFRALGLLAEMPEGGAVSERALSQIQSATAPSPPDNAVSNPLSGNGSESVSPATAGVGASVAEATPQAVPAVYSGEAYHLRITAQEKCWISSRADGARGRDYTLQPNESFVLAYTKELELTLGNAGGVSLELNGRQLDPPGRRGQRVVLRFP